MKINPFDMCAGETATGEICLKEVSVFNTKSNKQYIRGKGVYDGGEYPVICWEEPLVDVFTSGSKVFNVLLVSDKYKDEMQYTVKEVFEDLGTDAVAEFYRTIDISALEKSFNEFMNENFSDKYLELIKEIIPEEIMRLFYLTPAATSHHDNLCGGLPHHTFKVMRILRTLIDIYGLQEKKEFILLCGLLHDIGKIAAIDYRDMEYTLKGGKITHEGLGILYMATKMRVLRKYLTSAEIDNLIGVVENHRGYDYGARPATLEAYLVHYADNTEAQITSLLEFTESQNKVLTKETAVWFKDKLIVIEPVTRE